MPYHAHAKRPQVSTVMCQSLPNSRNRDPVKQLILQGDRVYQSHSMYKRIIPPRAAPCESHSRLLLARHNQDDAYDIRNFFT